LSTLLSAPSPPRLFFFELSAPHPDLHSFPTRRSSDLPEPRSDRRVPRDGLPPVLREHVRDDGAREAGRGVPVSPILMLDGLKARSEEHTSELQSLTNLVCRLLLEKKKKKIYHVHMTKQ